MERASLRTKKKAIETGVKEVFSIKDRDHDRDLVQEGFQNISISII